MTPPALASAGLFLIALGCAPPAPPAAPLDPAAFLEAKEKIAEYREKTRAERTESIKLELDAPYLPSKTAARGAVAVRPPDALRMMLVGPGGATAMDLWMRGARYRFEIPGLERTLSGSTASPPAERKGLPVDFLSWWMFEPLGGRLLAARRAGPDLEVILDEPGRSTVALLRADGSIHAHRRWVAPGDRGRFVPYEEEWLEATGVGCARAVYRQKSTSLVVTVTCEASRPSVAERAFDEPGAPAP